jgi:hypothetical protein
MIEASTAGELYHIVTASSAGTSLGLPVADAASAAGKARGKTAVGSTPAAASVPIPAAPRRNARREEPCGGRAGLPGEAAFDEES